ncbi:ATP-dependent carboxylate-amine ligase [Paenibacillus lutrae]|uniref:ATP-dependent carboxylate-amine ligase n=1 Tax=Paenibacillus lutrae TaxID=2078573 RepID=A0A7X3FK35_9BACL|nr:ATP-dependent carboxylate-amine ligase [Paenibacillus lutrae]MVP01151.1 ATP-dependent carboxylate-amine ligase [Paenibacillus lutrae]
MNTNDNGGAAVLITGGRAPAALELARQLDAAGYRVYAADSVARPLIRYSASIQQFYRVPGPRFNRRQFLSRLLDIIGIHRIQVLIPTCEEIFYVAEGKAELEAGGCRVFTDDLDKLLQLHSKWAFNQLVQAMGLPAPRTLLLTSYGELSQLHDPGSLHKWVLKPVYSRFASRTLTYAGGEIPPRLVISPEFPWVAQTFVTGLEYCTYAIAEDGELRAYTDYSVDYTAGKGASIYFRQQRHPELFEWVQAFVHELRFTGQLAFDFIIDRDGTIWPLECNPRATSGLHLFSAEDRIGDAFIAPAKGAVNLESPCIIPRKPAERMITAAMLLYGPGRELTPAGLRRWTGCMFRGRDVIFQWRDPGPFLAQGMILLDFWKQARTAGRPVKEMTTYDMEWNGEYESPCDRRDGISGTQFDRASAE